MSDIKFPPGSLEYVPSTENRFPMLKVHSELLGDRFICVNEPMAEDMDPYDALARLLAAAPDLLAALLAVLSWIDDYCETSGFEAVEAQADAAILKAFGEDV
jgi:hypothetical protein